VRPLGRVDFGWPDEDDYDDDEEDPTGLGLLANLPETDQE